MAQSWNGKAAWMHGESATDAIPMDWKAKYQKMCGTVEGLGKRYYLVAKNRDGALDVKEQKALGSLVSRA